ncbi:MAG: hypothetical protein U0Y10_27610 [Spirosomataceae bacterium]
MAQNNVRFPTVNNRKNSLFLLRSYLIYFSIFAFIFQLTIDSSVTNITCNALSLFLFILTCIVTLHPRNDSPERALIAVVIFFICISNSLFTMLGTLAEGHSLTNTLLIPSETFFHRTIYNLCLIIAFLFTQSQLFLPIRSLSYRLGSLTKTRSILPVKAVWMLGIIGFSSYILKQLSLSVTFIKILDGFGFLTWTPFILLVPPYTIKKGKQRLLLLLYYGIQIGLSLANNSRLGMVGPLSVILMGWLYGLLLGYININSKIILRGILFSFIGIVLSSQLVQISNAILVGRAGRESRSSLEQIKVTLEYIKDSQALQDLKNEQLMENSRKDIWQENYVANPFFARFIQIKFDDNCLYRISTFSSKDFEQLEDITTQKNLALMPEPMLQFLRIGVNKKEVNSYSLGDLIDVISGRGFLGGLKTGSIPAHAYAIYKERYPLVLILMYSVIFGIVQGLFGIKRKFGQQTNSIPTLAMLLPFHLYTWLTPDGITSLYSLLFRGMWQTILLYFISILIIKRLGLLRQKNPSLALSNKEAIQS